MHSRLAALALLGLLAAGCASAPSPSTAPAATPTTTHAAPPTAVANVSAVLHPEVLHMHNCVGVETVAFVPASSLDGQVPSNFTIIPATALLGTTAPADPSASILLVGTVCASSSGLVNSTRDGVWIAGVLVQAPPGLGTGDDFVVLGVVASSPALTALYAAGGFPVQQGQVTYTDSGTPLALQATVNIQAPTLALQQQGNGPPGSPQPGFNGRFFAVHGGQLAGVVDFAIDDGAAFGSGGGAWLATSGTVAGQTAGSGISGPFVLSTWDQTFHTTAVPAPRSA